MSKRVQEALQKHVPEEEMILMSQMIEDRYLIPNLDGFSQKQEDIQTKFETLKSLVAS